jgi:hypothetical protein
MSTSLPAPRQSPSVFIFIGSILIAVVTAFALQPAFFQSLSTPMVVPAMIMTGAAILGLSSIVLFVRARELPWWALNLMAAVFAFVPAMATHDINQIPGRVRANQAESIRAVAPTSPWLPVLAQYGQGTASEDAALDAQLIELDRSVIGLPALESLIPFRSLPQTAQTAAILGKTQTTGSLDYKDRVILVKYASALPLTMQANLALASLR